MINDGVPAFLVALVLVLMLTLVAVVRLPRWTETQSSEDDQPESEPAAGQLVSSWPAPDSSAPDWSAPGRPQAAGLAAAASASGRPRGAHAKHAHVRSAPADARQPSNQTAAAPADGPGPSVPSAPAAPRAQPREAGYAARSGARSAGPGAGAVPWRGTVRVPKVSGNPPWEPAPKPPGPATSLRDP